MSDGVLRWGPGNLTKQAKESPKEACKRSTWENPLTPPPPPPPIFPFFFRKIQFKYLAL